MIDKDHHYPLISHPNVFSHHPSSKIYNLAQHHSLINKTRQSMRCGPSTSATIHTPTPPSASIAPPYLTQLAIDFLNRWVQLFLEKAERDRLRNQLSDLAVKDPAYVPKLSENSTDISNQPDNEE